MADLQKLVEIIEDKAALEHGLRIIIEAAVRKRLPEESFLPTFNDEMTEDLFIEALEAVTGDKY